MDTGDRGRNSTATVIITAIAHPAEDTKGTAIMAMPHRIPEKDHPMEQNGNGNRTEILKKNHSTADRSPAKKTDAKETNATLTKDVKVKEEEIPIFEKAEADLKKEGKWEKKDPARGSGLTLRTMILWISSL